jgi:phage anti-repressor protein
MGDLAIGKDGKQWIDARNLHERLEVGRDFSTWIKDRIEEHGFEEGKDYQKTKILSSPNLGSSKSRPQTMIEYFLSTGTAKEIVAGENNGKSREIRRLLVKVEEAWNNPEAVKKRAEQMGIIPQNAVYPGPEQPQIDDKGFKDAMWLYSIGAITLEDLIRFRFGGKNPPDERELKADPLDPIYLPYVKAIRQLRELPEDGFPMTADRLEKLIRGSVSSVHIMERQVKAGSPYKNKEKLDREACFALTDTYFSMYGYNYRKPGGLEHPEQEKLDHMTAERDRVKAKLEHLQPVYVWTGKTPEEFAEIRYLYETGAYDSARVRQELFGNQPFSAAALPDSSPQTPAAIGGIDYQRALETIKGIPGDKFPISHSQLARLSGKKQDEIRNFHKYLPDPRHKWLSYEDCRYLLDLVFGVIPVPKRGAKLGRKSAVNEKARYDL